MTLTVAELANPTTPEPVQSQTFAEYLHDQVKLELAGPTYTNDKATRRMLLQKYGIMAPQEIEEYERLMSAERL